MTTDEFFGQYDGKKIGWNGQYVGECVSLIKHYITEVIGVPVHYGNAKTWWTNPPPNFEKISDSPSAVPERGDIVIWGTAMGIYGHIAIATGIGDTNHFQSFDQNFPIGNPCGYIVHTYNGVLGWLRPPKGEQMACKIDEEKAKHMRRNVVYRAFDGWGEKVTEQDIQEHASWIDRDSGDTFNYQGVGDWVFRFVSDRKKGFDELKTLKEAADKKLAQTETQLNQIRTQLKIKEEKLGNCLDNVDKLTKALGEENPHQKECKANFTFLQEILNWFKKLFKRKEK
jgi:surface antigen